MSVKTITENLKSKSFSSLYYIYGQEEYLKSYYYNEFKKKVVTDMPDFNVIEFDIKNFDWMDFCNCVNSYPVMAERKFVGVVNFDNSLLRDKFTKEFVEFLKTIPEFCTVVFYDDETKNVSDSNSLLKAINSANGVAVNVEKPNTSALATWCARHFKKMGKQISAQDINYMLTIADNDMHTLVGEISKLCSYVSSDTIFREDIDAIVTRSIEANRFAIGEAFCYRKYDVLYDVVDKMYKQNVDDILIFNAIHSTIVDLYKVKLGMTCGKNAKEIGEDLFAPNKAFIASKNAKPVSALTLEFLEMAVDLSKQVDIKLKSLRCNGRDVVTFYIGELISRRERASKT